MKKTFINHRLVFFLIVFALLTVCGVLTLDEAPVLSVAVILLGAMLTVGYLLFVPFCFTLSRDGITVRYLPCFKYHLRWEDVSRVDDVYAGGRMFPWWREYELAYFTSPLPFHREARIPKTGRTTEQLRRYYRGGIDKYG